MRPHPSEPAVSIERDVTVAIVDDEPLARNGMRHLVSQLRGYRVVGDAGSGIEAVALIRATRPEIVLLDVQLPGLDAFGVLRALGDMPPPTIVFVTAFDAHAIRAFEVHAIDYVLKPYTDARLRDALAIARRARESARQAERLEQLRALLGALEAERAATGPEADTGVIAVRRQGRTDLVQARELLWIEGAGSYARLHTARGAILHRESLDSLASRLDSSRFVRVHRSAIVAQAAVRQARRTSGGVHVVILANGAQVRASRRGWQALRARLSRGTRVA